MKERKLIPRTPGENLTKGGLKFAKLSMLSGTAPVELKYCTTPRLYRSFRRRLSWCISTFVPSFILLLVHLLLYRIPVPNVNEKIALSTHQLKPDSFTRSEAARNDVNYLLFFLILTFGDFWKKVKGRQIKMNR